MKAHASGARLFERAAFVAVFGLLPACDKIDVTSSVDLPSARCASCHLPEYLAADHPLHRGVKPTTCATCHGEDSFHPMRLTHSFPLDGAHQKADCFACHTGAAPVFEGTPKSCATCHATEHQRANDSVPKHPSFGDDCAHCHGTSAWKPTLEARPSAERALAPATTPPAPEHAPIQAPAPKSLATSSEHGNPSIPTTTPNEPPSPASRRKKPDTVSGASPAHKR
jgi:hypothetical protein